MRKFSALVFLGIIPLSAREVPIRALLVCGGCCHDYAKQSVILRDGIQARANVQVDVVRSADGGTKPWFPMYQNKDWATGYDVVIHDECAAETKDMLYVRNIVDAHKNGLPAVNLHCAMHSYRTGTDVWFEFLGLQSSGHGPQKPIALDFTVAPHPITEGMANWTTIGEELYNNVKVFGSAKPLALGNQNQGNGKTESSVIAWTNDYHGTRVFNTTLGHNNQTVADDRYLNLVVRGLLWSCNKLNPKFLEPYAGPSGHMETIPAGGPRAEISTAEIPKNGTPVQVTASSVQDDNGTANAVDGSKDSRWCAANASFPQWLQLDFGAALPMSAVKIVWESDNRAYHHVIAGSNDGKEWTTLSDAAKNKKDGDTVSQFPEAKYKYVKITCTGATQGGWASIREINVKGNGIGPLFPKMAQGEAKKQNAESYKKGGNTRPHISRLTPEQETAVLKDVQVADGFEASLFATSSAANYPVYVAASPAGDVYVASDGNGSLGRDPNRGRIMRLRDTDNDGRADQVTEFVKNVDSPRGMVWDHDRLYVVHPPDVSCYIDYNGDGQADEEKVLIKGIAFGFADRPADHTTNGLAMGIDGWLYIAGGDFGFKDAVGTDGKHLQHRNGGVLRFRPDGSGLEIFSTGTRNILEVAVGPLLEMFARDNTNDGGGWNVRFHHFTGLEDHGYPRLYINFGDEIVKPLADYGGGSGCGAAYLSEPGIPEKWNNAPLTCDWGTNALWRHSVRAKGATFEEFAKPEPLVKMTRPTDATVDGMSRIYQASWKGATFNWEGPDVGYIVQVKPKGYLPKPLPDFDKATYAELAALMESPSQVRVMEAQRAWLRKPGVAGRDARALLASLAANPAKPLTGRVAAIYALLRSGETPAVELGELASDPAIRPFVARAAADVGLKQPALFSTTLQSSEPRARLESIAGVARLGLTELAPQVAKSLGDADPVIAHTAFQCLAKLKASDACFGVLDQAAATPAERTGALRALMRIHEPAVVQGLIDRLAKAGSPEARAGYISALCRLYFHDGEWKGDSWGTRPDTRGPYYQPEPWSESPKIAAVMKETLAKADPSEAPALINEMSRNRIKFDEALERLARLGNDNPAVLPDLVAQLAAAETLPTFGIASLLKAVRADLPPATLALAISTLAKTDSEEGFLASMDALEKLAANKDAAKAFDSARTAFLAAPKLENRHGLLEERGAAMSGPTARWADAGLLALAARNDGSPESRLLSRKALEKGWADSKRRMQIMDAIRLIGSHQFDDEVLDDLDSPDPSVAEAAKQTAVALKLEKKGEDKTPLVGSLKPDEVIAAVLKTQGSAALGAQMFNKQGCMACHAVRPDEVQKGPYLGNIAQTYNRSDLAANILDPNRTIAQGFATEMITLKDGSGQVVFITLESADQVKGRNIAGQEFTWKTADIATRAKLPTSMMPPGLANSMTVRQFASMLDYFESLSKK